MTVNKNRRDIIYTKFSVKITTNSNDMRTTFFFFYIIIKKVYAYKKNVSYTLYFTTEYLRQLNPYYLSRGNKTEFH